MKCMAKCSENQVPIEQSCHFTGTVLQNRRSEFIFQVDGEDGRMKKSIFLLMAMLMGGMSLSGCVAAAIGGAYVIGEELNEDDGDFDPLDEVVDG